MARKSHLLVCKGTALQTEGAVEMGGNLDLVEKQREHPR